MMRSVRVLWVAGVAMAVAWPVAVIRAAADPGAPGAARAVKTSGVDKPVARKPSAETPAVETPVDETPVAVTPTAEKPAADKPAAEKPAVAKPDVKADAVAKAATPKDSAAKAVEKKDRPKRQPAAPKKELSPAMAALRDRVRSTLAMHFQQQPPNLRDNNVTDLLDFCLAFGCDSEVYRGDPANQKVNGITCLCWNLQCGAYQPLVVSDGHLAARVGYGMQQYPGQMLAVLAQSRVPADYPARAGALVRTVADLVESEKLACRSGNDQSLRLVGLAYYGPSGSWKNSLGEDWSLERMVLEELQRPVVGSAGGGATRLLALSAAVERRQRRKQPIDGEFARARKFLADFQGHAMSVQNDDGSWGPQGFASAGASRDYVANVCATGYVAEWLASSLAEDQIEDAHLVKAIDYLDGMLNGQRYRWNTSSLSGKQSSGVMHGLHALMVYDQRAFRPSDPKPGDKKAAEKTAAQRSVDASR